MKVGGNLSERYRMNVQAFTISSIAEATSIPISMADYDKVTFAIGMGTAAANLNPSIKLYKATASTHAGSSFRSTTIGSTQAARILTARRAIVTFTTDSTFNTSAIVINGVVFECSNSTAKFQAATGASARCFGSTLESSAAEGLEERARSLSSLVNNVTWGVPGLTAATITTADVRLTVDDTASTSINITTAMSGITVANEACEALLEVHADQLGTAYKWVYAKLSTIATAADVSIGSFRGGARHTPVPVHGTLYKATST